MEENKKAKTADEAWDMQEKYEGKPHCWIMWKNLCTLMDFHCACGAVSCVVGWFAYNVRCPVCGKVYSCNGHIELIEIEDSGSEICILTGDLD